MRLLHLVYFGFASAISICIFTNTYLDQCIYAVGAFSVIDFALMEKVKPDMVLHHIFALCIVAYFYNHVYPITYDVSEKNLLVKSVLSTEISSIFLSARRFIPRRLSVVAGANMTAFVGTFVYYRIYKYGENVILRPTTHAFIGGLSHNTFHSMYFYSGLYGLFALNLYWLLWGIVPMLVNLYRTDRSILLRSVR